jgi:acyl carrier protein
MVEAAVQKAIAEQFCLGETPVNLDAPLSEYDADSLDLVELVMTIEDELKIEIPDDDFIGPDVTKMTGRQLVEIATKAKG